MILLPSENHQFRELIRVNFVEGNGGEDAWHGHMIRYVTVDTAIKTLSIPFVFLCLALPCIALPCLAFVYIGLLSTIPSSLRPASLTPPHPTHTHTHLPPPPPPPTSQSLTPTHEHHILSHNYPHATDISHVSPTPLCADVKNCLGISNCVASGRL